MATTVCVPKVCDTNIQDGYNLPNVNLVINGVSCTSNDETVSINTGGTFVVTATKQHYNNYTKSGCRVIAEYECDVCGSLVSGSTCSVCGEPLNVGTKTPVYEIVADEIGKIKMTRMEDVCMTQKDFNESIISATSIAYTMGLGESQRLLTNKSYGSYTPNSFVNQYLSDKITSAVTSGTKQAFVFERDFIPKEVLPTDPYYIRIVSGKTHSVDSTEQVIESVIKSNIPYSAITFTSNKSWINNIRFYEDRHGDFSLITMFANVDENDSFTDDRSGVITVDSGSYGITKTIPVTQSAKTGYSSYDITFNDSLNGYIDANDFVEVYGSDGNTCLSHYSAVQYFGASSLQLPNIPTSAMTPIGEQPNLYLIFDLTETVRKGASVTISSGLSEEREINLNSDNTSGALSFKNLLGDTTNKIHIETGTEVSQSK